MTAGTQSSDLPHGGDAARRSTFAVLLRQQQTNYHLGTMFYLLAAAAMSALIAIGAWRALHPELQFDPLITGLTALGGGTSGGGAIGAGFSLRKQASEQMERAHEYEKEERQRASS